MDNKNREAIERMFRRVVSAGKRFGMDDDELRLLLDDILLDGDARSPVVDKKPVEQATATPEVSREHTEELDKEMRKAGPDEVVPELDEPYSGTPDVPVIVSGDEPVTLEGLGLGKVVTPVRLKPPGKSEWDEYAAGKGPLKER